MRYYPPKGWKAFFSRLPDSRHRYYAINRCQQLIVKHGKTPEQAPESLPELFLMREPFETLEAEQAERKRQQVLLEAVRLHRAEFVLLCEAFAVLGPQIRAWAGPLKNY